MSFRVQNMSRKPIKPGHLELINQRGREPIQPPRLLAHIQKHSVSQCEQLLAHLFSATDDLFYDLSKRASSNHEQNLYFEAMREIRVRREGIANRFLRTISQNFSDLIDANTQAEFDNWEPQRENNLSIVDGDDLEVDLARSNMVSRTRDVYREELYELGMRLDHLLLQIEVSEDNNPLDPNQLTKAFIDACQSTLDINIKAKLILYKLFEKHVLKQLGHIYADANQSLMDAGILPKVPKNLDNKVVHGGAPQQPAGAAQPAAQAITSAFAPVPEFRMGYDALSMLLSAARNFAFIGNPAPAGTSGAAPANGGNPGLSCYIYTANPGPVMAAPELTSLLTQSQPTYDQILATGTPRNIVADAVHQILAQKNPNQPQALEQNEENVINLVAMFFDQILADEALPVEVQSLICRLQIPILKVALRDRTFFSNPEHAARKLVNTITRVGMGFDNSKPLDRDPLFRKIVDVVQILNRQYKTDDRIFLEMQAELDELMEKESRKSTVVEQRTTQTEAGKSRIKQARTAAQTALYHKLKNVDLPEFVRSFLTSHWLQVMVITHLKQGADSTEWVSNEQTVSDLIWICQNHEDARSLQRRERLLPELLDRIEKGLEVAIDSRDARKSKVTALEAALKLPPTAPQIQETVAPLNLEQKEALGKGENAPKTWDEMTAVERQQARYEELATGYYEMAKNMPEGTWLEYFDEESGKKLRCKLASKIDADTYIFVNRLGFKALEKTRKQFAYDMQFNRAKLVDTRPFFDRIMGKVVNNLTNQNAP
jgi:hypothetical protein